MNITFPPNPTTGDTFTAENGVVYTYDGTKWVAAGTGGGTVPISTGNIGFVGDAIYDLNGMIIENADLSHGATAAMVIPANGSTSPIQLNNTYGNIALSAGNNAVLTATYTFGKTGNITLPSNTSNINYANGVSILSGIGGGSGNYGNSNVATFLASFGANVISTTGNITAGFVKGDGSQLTNLPAGNYSNSNVTALLASFGSNSISTSGNITATNFIGNIPAADGNTSVQINIDGHLGAAAGFNYAGNTLYAHTASFSGNPDSGVDGLYTGVPGFTILGSSVMTQVTGNVIGYSQTNFQNISDSPVASGDYIITSDNGTDSTHFLDLGITSSTWDGTQENSLGNILGPGDGYLYVQDGNLALAVKDGIDQHVWYFDNVGALNLPNPGTIRAANTLAGPVNLVSNNFVQLQWTTDVANVDPNSTDAITNWAYIDSNGFSVEMGVNDTGNTHSWFFSNNGNLNLPTGGYIGPAGVKGDGTMITGGNGNITSLTSYYSSGMYSSCVTDNADGTLNISTYGDGTGLQGQWTFTGANLVLAPTNVGDAGSNGTPGEAQVLRGSRKIINGVYTGATNPFAVELPGDGSATVVYKSETGVNINSAKVTFAVQGTGVGANWEQFDVVVTYDYANSGLLLWVVSNRIKANPLVADTIVTAVQGGLGELQILLQLPVGQNGWASFDATEFGLMVD